MKRIVHAGYFVLGCILYALHRLRFAVSVRMHPVQETKILFVAHPDDDVLFFHSVLQTEKPYVVLLTTGFYLRRILEFRKAMRLYGLRYNYYCFATKDKREDKLENVIRKELAAGNYAVYYSHAPHGEYGHEMHRRVGRLVEKCVSCTWMHTVPQAEIEQDCYALPPEEVEKKIHVFQTIYKSQIFVLKRFAPWVSHEAIVEQTKN